MSEEAIFEIKRDFIEKLASEGKRMDGRAFDEFREIKLEKKPISLAEGSARVHIGKTSVMAGVKAAIGTPYPDRPNSGTMITTAELRPMAYSGFELGPPRPNAIELARVVDRGVRESGMIPVENLCIKAGEKVWLIFGDIHILDYCGNLFDTASLALVAALKDATIPAANFPDVLEKDFKIETKETPISVTAVKIGNSILFDPSLEEEKVATARITVATDSKGCIRAMQKGLAGRFTNEEIDHVVEVAVKRGVEIREQLFGEKTELTE